MSKNPSQYKIQEQEPGPLNNRIKPVENMCRKQQFVVVCGNKMQHVINDLLGYQRVSVIILCQHVGLLCLDHEQTVSASLFIKLNNSSRVQFNRLVDQSINKKLIWNNFDDWFKQNNPKNSLVSASQMCVLNCIVN